MARLVKRTLSEPAKYVIDGKEVWFCRCGLSKNQPYCDGSHKAVGMRPVKFTAPETKQYWMCGCKTTKGQPMCDGSHKTVA